MLPRRRRHLRFHRVSDITLFQAFKFKRNEQEWKREPWPANSRSVRDSVLTVGCCENRRRRGCVCAQRGSARKRGAILSHRCDLTKVIRNNAILKEITESIFTEIFTKHGGFNVAPPSRPGIIFTGPNGQVTGAFWWP